MFDDKNLLSDDKEPLSDDKELLFDDKEPLSDDKEPLFDDKEPLSDDKKPFLSGKEPLSFVPAFIPFISARAFIVFVLLFLFLIQMSEGICSIFVKTATNISTRQISAFYLNFFKLFSEDVNGASCHAQLAGDNLNRLA